MRRPRILGIAGVACVALAILLGLSATLHPALPLLASSYLSQSPHRLQGAAARYDRAVVGESGQEDQDQVSSDVNREDLQPVSYLPLVLKGYPSTTHWSGTARFGFGVADRPIERYNVDLLNADWYVRFGFRSDPPPLDLEFVQTIRLCEENEDETLCWPFTSPRTCASDYSPSQAAIVEYATEHRGTLWLVGNEPDCPFQDCITPSRYAELYHELYYIIKSADPTAKVAIGGVVQATPLRRDI